MMSKLSFTTGSGRKVYFEQLTIRISSLGFLEGSPERIRSAVLRRLPGEVCGVSGQWGLFLREPPPGPLPAFTFIAQFHSAPIGAEANSSSLVVVWFANTLPDCLPVELLTQLEGIEWE
ncbi:MAG: hypothetical protein ACOYMS_09960, partial [Terrimicrobiaceae bacterium]